MNFADLGAFVLAVIAVIINGVPQLLYAQARGFAIKPAVLPTLSVLLVTFSQVPLHLFPARLKQLLLQVLTKIFATT